MVHQLVAAFQAERSSTGTAVTHKLELTHDCQSTACDGSGTACSLCKNALVKRCTGLLKKRYRDVEAVQALCKGLITCRLAHVPASITDSVTHFRVRPATPPAHHRYPANQLMKQACSALPSWRPTRLAGR